MQIEENFRDHKNQRVGLNLKESRIEKQKRFTITDPTTDNYAARG